MATDRSLELALRIRAAVEGAETVEDLRRNLGGLTDELEQAANPAEEFNQGLRETEDAGQRAGAGIKSASDKVGELTDVVKGFIGLAVKRQMIYAVEPLGRYGVNHLTLYIVATAIFQRREYPKFGATR